MRKPKNPHGAVRVADAIWAHGELYDTVATTATFISPPEHSTDTIYAFIMSGLEGQRSVSDSAPKDRDYNGGRWSAKAVVFTDAGLAEFDSDNDGIIDAELTSAEAVEAAADAGYLSIYDTTIYIECPMLPSR